MGNLWATVLADVKKVTWSEAATFEILYSGTSTIHQGLCLYRPWCGYTTGLQYLILRAKSTTVTISQLKFYHSLSIVITYITVTHCNVFRLWFTVRAWSASTVAPSSPISFHPRLWERVYFRTSASSKEEVASCYMCISIINLQACRQRWRGFERGLKRLYTPPSYTS